MSNSAQFPAGMQYVNANNDRVMLARGGILHTDVWRAMVPRYEELNQQLKDQILTYQAEHPTIDPMANPGCWRGSSEFEGWDTLRSFIIDNVKAIHRHYINIGAPCAPLESFSTDKFEMNYWANVNQPGSANAIHTHSKWHWSGVYYVQGTGTGELALYSQAYLNQQVTHGLPFGQSFTIPAEDGLMVMFPSYLMHEVMPNLSDKARINIAFNVKILF
ncbi:putative 2OG-Fe(II) oxygenase [Alteromonas facilis]|uniref:putative 2OG-Fe(II) oxygenase n=1 Tax=Alteromonas facilis TaxID=2048004 RepID=UPI000C28EB05|nr:putative 2OG-Fe(II) oxygenase [Alteromonas facilis]